MFSGGLIVVVYFVMAIIVPTTPVSPTTEDTVEPESAGNDQTGAAAADAGDPAATESQAISPAPVAQEAPSAAGADRRAGAAVIVWSHLL